VTDVTPAPSLVSAKEALIEKGYSVCDTYIEEYGTGKLERQPGFNAEQTLEVRSHRLMYSIVAHRPSCA